MVASLLRIPKGQQTFGQAIRWAREQQRLTLRQLGDSVGLSAPFLNDLEHDRRQTTKVAELASVLRVHLEDLEERQGLTADLKDWLGRRPDLLVLLREIRAGRRKTLVLRGGRG